MPIDRPFMETKKKGGVQNGGQRRTFFIILLFFGLCFKAKKRECSTA